MRSIPYDPRASDEVVVAQLEAFKRRVPILYAILIIDTVAMAITHFGLVGQIFTVYAPGIFCGFMAIRMVYWIRLPTVSMNPQLARKQLAKTTALAIALAMLIPLWALVLYIHAPQHLMDAGGLSQRGHTVLYIGLTSISCSALLVHSRRAATFVALIVVGPFCTYLLLTGTVVERAVSLNLTIVAVAMLYVLFAFAEEFELLIQSRHDLRVMGERQAYLANTDPLTDLSSRRRFLDCFEDEVRIGRPFALMMIDLDGFKQVNDLHGHLVGDQVLAEIGRRLKRTANAPRCLARIGGDEFAVIAPCPQRETLLREGNSIIEACAQPIITPDGIVVTVGASIGISLTSGSECRVEPVRSIEQADYALSHVKQNGKGRVMIFEAAHERAVRRLGEVEQALRSADMSSEISVVYQPVVLSRSNELVGFEALARWHSAALGHVSPAEFVPAAERGGLICDLTLVILEKALAQLGSWPDWVELKINLSAHDVSSPRQMLRVTAAVERSGVRASRLTFELTESAFGGDLETVGASVNLIKATGASFAIDDFGTGYSSLSYVHRFNPDLIKIDRSFISRLDSKDDSTAIIKTIIEMSRNIGARCLAEGVETARQSEILRQLGVDEIQGYLYGKPMPAAAFDGMHSGSIVVAAAQCA